MGRTETKTLQRNLERRQFWCEDYKKLNTTVRERNWTDNVLTSDTCCLQTNQPQGRCDAAHAGGDRTDVLNNNKHQTINNRMKAGLDSQMWKGAQTPEDMTCTHCRSAGAPFPSVHWTMMKTQRTTVHPHTASLRPEQPEQVNMWDQNNRRRHRLPTWTSCSDLITVRKMPSHSYSRTVQENMWL